MAIIVIARDKTPRRNANMFRPMLRMAKSLARTCLLVAAVVACWLLAAEAASACPSCKEALAADAGGGDLISGFFWSILFMLSMPFLILASFGAYFYYLLRRARATPVATEA